MGNGSRQFTHRCDSTEMAELFTVLQCFQFSLFSSRNVDADSQKSRWFAIRIQVHTSARRHPTYNSIRQDQPILGIVIFTLMDCVVDYLSNAIAIVGMHARNESFEPNSSRSRPSQKGPSSISSPDLIFTQIPFPNPQINCVRNDAHALFTFLQRSVFVYQLRHVHA